MLVQLLALYREEGFLTMRIYVASSWRNPYWQGLCDALRADGHDVYDFKRAESSFAWTEVDPDNEPDAQEKRGTVVVKADYEWVVEKSVTALGHPKALRAFEVDRVALETADAVILCLPAGSSSHLEVGYARGRLVPCIVYLQEGVECLSPELMLHLLGSPLNLCRTVKDVRERLERVLKPPPVESRKQALAELEDLATSLPPVRWALTEIGILETLAQTTAEKLADVEQERNALCDGPASQTEWLIRIAKAVFNKGLPEAAPTLHFVRVVGMAVDCGADVSISEAVAAFTALMSSFDDVPAMTQELTNELKDWGLRP